MHRFQLMMILPGIKLLYGMSSKRKKSEVWSSHLLKFNSFLIKTHSKAKKALEQTT